MGTLRQLQDEGGVAAAGEQAVLARWGGWGALPGVFDPGDDRFDDVRGGLRRLLRGDEWDAAAATTLNAHYTDLGLVRTIWDTVTRMASGGLAGRLRVLEPGCGIGTFLGCAPRGVAWDKVGVELDPTTAAIAQALHPDATIHAGGIEAWRCQPGEFDVAVGNVPFAKHAPYDPAGNRDRLSLHNYVIRRALHAVKPGGVVAVITSHYTLDARNPAARRALHELGDLVAAVRLPSGAHLAAAGTEVVTDLVVLRRRPVAAPTVRFDWETTVDVDVAGGAAPLNHWFVERPDAVLGELKVGDGPYGPSTVSVTPTGRLADVASQAAAVLAAQIEVAGRHGLRFEVTAPRTASPEPAAPDDGRRTPGSLVVVDGRLAAVDDHGELGSPAPATVRREPEVALLVALRDQVRRVLAAQSATAGDGSDSWERERERLNALYDDYRERYGPINRSARVVRRKDGEEIVFWRSPLPVDVRRDPGWPLLCGLELFDEATQTATKAAVFDRRVVDPYREPLGADSPEEALLASMAARGGRVDLDHVAYLAGMDPDASLAALVDAARVFFDPDKDCWVTAESYLQGNVRAKLAAAETAAQARLELGRNVEALRAVMPADLGPGDIYVGLGSAWLPVDTITAFCAERLDVDSRQVQIGHSETLGEWFVKADGWARQSTSARAEWGTERADLFVLLGDALNRRKTEVVDEIDDGTGRTRRVVNEQETVAALQKRHRQERAFTDWVFTDPTRTQELCARYNERFNSFVEGRFDGSHLMFPGLSTTFTPHQHQRDAVWRFVAGDRSMLLGLPVGAGKTATIVMTVMEQRRLGTATRPLVVVPPAVLAQFARETQQLYPAGRFLVMTGEDLTVSGRHRFLARAALHDWDAIIMADTTFGRLPVRDDTKQAHVAAETARMRAALYEAENGGDRLAVKAIEKRLANLQASTARRVDGKTRDQLSDGLCFEELGCDLLVVDEAHRHKGLDLAAGRMGLAQSVSQRAEDLAMKLDWIRARHGDKTIMLSTATPISNSLAEAWVWLRMAAPGLLDDLGVRTFTGWSSVFAQTVTSLETTVGGVPRFTTRWAQFANVAELQRMLRQVAVIRTAGELQLPAPTVAGGRAQLVRVEASPELAFVMHGLGQRADELHSGYVDPRHDNMLKVIGEGRQATLDPRLVGAAAPENGGKITAAAHRIFELWQANSERRYTARDGGRHPIPGALQLAFCDLGVPRPVRDGQPGRWSAYHELRDQLVALGMPTRTIRFVQEAATPAAREQLFEECRNGGVGVLVASTHKAGVGLNVQTRLAHVHWLTIPWRHIDFEQGNGRAVRQGNQNPEVGIHLYVAEGGLDGFVLQLVELKGRMAEQLARGDLTVRTVGGDLGEEVSVSYAEFRAASFGDDRLRTLTELAPRIAELEALRADHDRQQAYLAGRRHSAGAELERLTVDEQNLAAAIGQRLDTSGDRFFADIDGSRHNTRADAGAHLVRVATETLSRFVHREPGVYPVEVGWLAGLPVRVDVDVAGVHPRVRVRFPAGGTLWPTYTRDELRSVDGAKLIDTLQRAARRLDPDLDGVRTRLMSVRGDLERAESLAGSTFAGADELRRLHARQAVLVNELRAEADARASTPDPGRPAEPTLAERVLAGVIASPAKDSGVGVEV